MKANEFTMHVGATLVIFGMSLFIGWKIIPIALGIYVMIIAVVSGRNVCNRNISVSSLNALTAKIGTLIHKKFQNEIAVVIFLTLILGAISTGILFFINPSRPVFELENCSKAFRLELYGDKSIKILVNKPTTDSNGNQKENWQEFQQYSFSPSEPSGTNMNSYWAKDGDDLILHVPVEGWTEGARFRYVPNKNWYVWVQQSFQIQVQSGIWHLFPAGTEHPYYDNNADMEYMHEYRPNP